MVLKTVWDFVERYYPNYSQSDEILLNDTLQKVVDHEETEGDCAHKKYLELEEVAIEEFGKDLDPDDLDSKIRMFAQFQLNGSNEDIYESSIESFIEEQNSLNIKAVTLFNLLAGAEFKNPVLQKQVETAAKELEQFLDFNLETK